MSGVHDASGSVQLSRAPRPWQPAASSCCRTKPNCADAEPAAPHMHVFLAVAPAYLQCETVPAGAGRAANSSVSRRCRAAHFAGRPLWCHHSFDHGARGGHGQRQQHKRQQHHQEEGQATRAAGTEAGPQVALPGCSGQGEDCHCSLLLYCFRLPRARPCTLHCSVRQYLAAVQRTF